ncbi:MAG: TetR/AcrR family transcriptional regulator [Schleiferiaceae bacterium]|jgi:AcrR family transcriptional regulator|nr:TetR/AcrR family transcriptional regulator [Schleiferiaceae bacterium]
MEETHRKIIEESVQLFLKFGVRSVTMDDVSRELGISKKTLYKYVSNKTELVDQGVKITFKKVMEDLKAISDKTENAIDELFTVDEYFDDMMRTQHPAMLYQLKKYHAETFGWLDKSKVKFILDTTRKNLKKGTEQGYYRTDINHDYIAYIYLAHSLLMESDNDSIPETVCESSEFHREHVLYHIRGIASPKGLEYLKQKLNKNEG